MFRLLKPNPQFEIRNSFKLVLSLFFPILILIWLGIGLINSPKQSKVSANSQNFTQYWDIQSIDTMKYSRDMAAAKLNDQDFDAEIGTEVRNIKSTGANYVAIATPYDEKFIPYLKRWVSEARKNNIHVWFRGNFSAWEGWFGTKKGMSLEDHTAQIVNFIKNHPDLFEDGDIFSSCPECENGAFGDPRQNGKLEPYRNFIISETIATKQAFKDIRKNVATNYWSMNLDVARLVMDRDTVQKLGGVIVIDHYVKDPEKLGQDSDNLASATGAKIVLGEFGAPIPDLNGNLNESEQADWVSSALGSISKSNSIIGINYWVYKGGSTGIWDEGNHPKAAVAQISKFFNPLLVTGHIKDEFGNPIDKVTIRSAGKQLLAKNGGFTVIYDGSPILIRKEGYFNLDIKPQSASQPAQITLIKENKNLVDLVRLWLHRHITFKLP